MCYIRQEWRQWLHRMGRLLAVFLVLAFLVWGVAAGALGGAWRDKSPSTVALFRLGVVDQEQDSYTELLLRYFEESDAFSSYVEIKKGTQEDIQGQFAKGQLDGWLVIPEGFISGMVAIDHVPLVVTLSLADMTKAVLLQQVFEAYGSYVAAVEGGCMTLYRQMELAGADKEQLERANVEVSLELILAALGREDFFHYEEQTDSRFVPLLAYYGFSLLGLLPFLLAIPGGIVLLEEKRNGVLARIRITNGGLAGWFGSKLLVEGGLAALLVTAAGVALKKGIGTEVKAGQLIASALLCIGIVCVMLLAACLAGERREYLLAAGMSVLLLAMFGGSLLPLSYLPEAMAAAAEWMPNRILAALWM